MSPSPNMPTTCRFCDRAGLVKYPSSRSELLSVVGLPPQDANYGRAGGSKSLPRAFLRHGQMRAHPVLRPCSGHRPPPLAADRLVRRSDLQGRCACSCLHADPLMLVRNPLRKPVPSPSPRRLSRTSTSPATWSPVSVPRPRSPSSCRFAWRCVVPRPSMAT